MNDNEKPMLKLKSRVTKDMEEELCDFLINRIPETSFLKALVKLYKEYWTYLIPVEVTWRGEWKDISCHFITRDEWEVLIRLADNYYPGKDDFLEFKTTRNEVHSIRKVPFEWFIFESVDANQLFEHRPKDDITPQTLKD